MLRDLELSDIPRLAGFAPKEWNMALDAVFLEHFGRGYFPTGLVMRDTSLDLMDTMPAGDSLEQIRAVVLSVPGVLGVEKCFARKTGLQHHVDLHLEADPNLTVWESHDIATLARLRLCEQRVGLRTFWFMLSLHRASAGTTGFPEIRTVYAGYTVAVAPSW